MQVDAGAVLTGVTLVVGGIVWMVRLEGRLNLTDARYGDLKSDLQEIKDDVKAIRKAR